MRSTWRPLAGLGLVLAGFLVACSGGAELASSSSQPTQLPQDRQALAVLSEVAPQALKLEGGTVTGTECWTPSEHLFLDPADAPPGTWKVLCRVHYDLNGVARYQDANCIGDFNKYPMLDHCYVWKFHFGTPRYEDGDTLASAPPTPLPAP